MRLSRRGRVGAGRKAPVGGHDSVRVDQEVGQVVAHGLASRTNVDQVVLVSNVFDDLRRQLSDAGIRPWQRNLRP